MIWVILIIAIIIVLFIWIKSKRLHLDSLVFINGGIKTGKSLLSVYLAVKDYKRRHAKWWRHEFLYKYWTPSFILQYLNHLGKLNKVGPDDPYGRFIWWHYEEPLLYSNIPLFKIKYVPLTEDLLNRNVRANYGSVYLTDEVSLLLSSIDIKDNVLNEKALLKVKLFAHELGGNINGNGAFMAPAWYLNSQSPADMHFSFKRCINKNLYIHSSMNLPFFKLLRVREMMFSEDNQSAVNVFNEDIENTMKWLLVPKKYYKMYDRYCYSSLTDNNPVINDTVYLEESRKQLKTKHIVSFKKFLSFNNNEDSNTHEDTKTSDVVEEIILIDNDTNNENKEEVDNNESNTI